jgi:hypothetical protein
MSRALCFVLWALLSTLLMGGSCDEPEAVPLEELRRDAAPAFDYGLYSDAQGKLVGSRSAVLLVHRAGHLERVYEDAQGGDARAKVLFGQLEDTFQRTGNQLAQRASGLVCNSMPACVVAWHQLEDYMPSHGPGGLRLRQQMADSFAHEAKVQHVRNVVLAAALDVLLVGAVLTPGSVAAVEVEAGTAEASVGPVEAGRLALAGVEGELAAEELPALEARMAEAEALEPGPRHPSRLEQLARHRPTVAEPPSGVEADTLQWKSYVAYWERRYEERAGTRPLPPGRVEVKPPLTWESYSSLLGRFQRSLEFQRSAVRVLQQAQAPGGDRAWVPGMEQPLAAENLGLKHEGSTALTYADGFVVDKSTLSPGSRPNIHSFSVKQRDFSSMSKADAIKQVKADAVEAQTKYGGTVEVRRPGHPLFRRKVVVNRVHLVYDGEKVLSEFKNDLSKEAAGNGVELHFHVP